MWGPIVCGVDGVGVRGHNYDLGLKKYMTLWLVDLACLFIEFMRTIIEVCLIWK